MTTNHKMKDKITNNREILKGISNELKKLVQEGKFNTINEALAQQEYKAPIKEFKTLQQWAKDGFNVIKGQKAFLFWGKPLERIDEEGKEFSFFPISYLFARHQVQRRAERREEVK